MPPPPRPPGCGNSHPQGSVPWGPAGDSFAVLLSRPPAQAPSGSGRRAPLASTVSSLSRPQRAARGPQPHGELRCTAALRGCTWGVARCVPRLRAEGFLGTVTPLWCLTRGFPEACASSRPRSSQPTQALVECPLQGSGSGLLPRRRGGRGGEDSAHLHPKWGSRGSTQKAELHEHRPPSFLVMQTRHL